MLPQTGNIGDKTIYHCRRTSQKCAAYVKIAMRITIFRYETSINAVNDYGTPEGTFLFQYLPEKKLKQKELEKKSNQ